MTKITTTLLVVAALAVSACSDKDRFGAGAGGDAGGAYGMNGSASDPRSVAYFNETVGDRVLFSVDQSTLSDTARTTLEAQARWLMANPEYGATIEGHADEQGTREYNLALGARRANAVQEFLVSRGVSPARLKTVSYGKERPLAICSEEACYAKNRRAVTVVAAGAGM
jgi:peptidoglycan-associated lipoprotein